MPKSPKISISFKEKYHQLYEWLQTKDNISAYICKLLMADMENEAHSIDIDARIEAIFMKFLKNGKTIVPMDMSKGEIESIESLSSEEKDLINSLY